MKLIIVLEGKSDMVIVRALLPPDVVPSCQFVGTGGRSTIASVARTLLIKHRAPIAVMFDSDTLDPTTILEIVQTTRHLLSTVAGDTPFDIIYCVPELESIFFEAPIDLQRIFPKFDSVFVPPLAKTQPKLQLNLLFEKGEGPENLSVFLDQLTSRDIKKLQSTYPIEHLLGFIKNNSSYATPV